MATNKKISEFPVTTSLAGNDAFLINHLGSTSTVSFSSLSSSITNDSIKLPSTATGGQVLTYNGSTTTWVASAVPKELPQTATTGQVLTYNGSTSAWGASSLSAQGFTVSKSTNGYTYLPNGIIMQWGITGIISAGDLVQETVTFPVSFPNACFNVTTSLSGNLYGQTDGLGTKRVQVVAANSLSNTSVVLEHTGLNPVRAYWHAIGY